MKHSLLALFLFISPFSLLAEESATSSSGDVRVPLDVYKNMLEQLRDKPKAAPASYAIGNSKILVNIVDYEDHTTADISVTLTVKTFEKIWTLVPILPHGAALTKVTVNGKPAQLVQGVEWLSWSTKKAGTSKIELQYNVDARRSESGFVLPLPVPRAAATKLTVKYPGKNQDMAIIPSSDLRTSKNKTTTTTIASIPTSSSVLISWRIPSKQSYIMSRADYKGTLRGDAIVWKANYNVEVFTGESVDLNLMPSSITLNDVLINKKSATIKEKNGQFVAILHGRGNYNVQVEFQVPILKDQGPPKVSISVPRVPISRFELTLPGKKEVKVIPKTNVLSKFTKNKTVATVYSPLSNQIAFTWVDAIPEDQKTQMRANANLFHSLYAEEGVLHGRAIIDFNVTHGETNALAFHIPVGVQVNRINSTTGGVSDWIATDNKKDKKSKLITVYLDRAIKGKFVLEVVYEQLIKKSETELSIAVPLLNAMNMHRQRGMVALLVGPELSLKPLEEKNVTKVGENQLPAFVRNTISMTVAHTYKYVNNTPELIVTTVAPEHKMGKFDAQVDTLISLGEVTMKGSATIKLDMKSGSVTELDLNIPKGVNVLNVAGPSIRNHNINSAGNDQTIHIEFTQEMDGQFRLDINYEKILPDKIAELTVPTIKILGAEVEHGRIAVEALTAVEVQPGITQQLSTMDINELPKQLILKTSNPILLAFKYVHAEPPYKLTLKMTRHKELDVQVAAIESANYQTLITNDGLAVTTAKFQIRNSRQQFLRLVLPENSQVWSVFVNNQAEKPANATDADGVNAVLIKMINSSMGFPVEIVYATTIDKMGMFGAVSTQLPQPNIVVTQSRWDVFMPAGPNYHSVDSNMNIITRGVWADPRQYAKDKAQRTKSAQHESIRPMRVNVPKQGILFSFEKLYANQSGEVAGFTIRYASASGNRIGIIVSLLGVLLIWFGIFVFRAAKGKAPQQTALALIIAGSLFLLIAMVYFKAEILVAAYAAIFGGIVYLIMAMTPKIQQWRTKQKDSTE
jgi:hypothetical protein